MEKQVFKIPSWEIKFVKSGEGISKVGEILDLGVEMGIIQKSGSWFAYNGDKLGQGRDAVKTILLDNEGLMDEIEAKIRAMVKGEPEKVAAALQEDL